MIATNNDFAKLSTRFHLFVTILILCCGFVASTLAEEPYQSERLKFATKLRQAQLFSIADNFCKRELKRTDLSAREQAMLAIQRIQISGDHGRVASPEERKEIWQQPAVIAKDFAKAHPDSPFLILVEVQSALATLSQGSLLRYEFESDSSATNSREQALKILRRASNELEQLRESGKRARINLQGNIHYDKSPQELEIKGLLENLEFYAARSFLFRALLYSPDDQANRVNAIFKVTKLHDELLRSMKKSNPLWWQLQLDRVLVLRSSEKYEEGLSLIREVLADQKSVSDEIGGRFLAENLRILIALNQIEQAKKVSAMQISSANVADFELARVEAFMHFGSISNEDSTSWQKKAVALTRQIESTYGRYWSRRANLLLVRAAESNPIAVDLQLLVKLADSNYLKGDFDEAIRTYESAAAKAKGAGDAKTEFSLLQKAAAVQTKRKNYVDASIRYETIAKSRSTDKRAAVAHRAAIVNAAESARTDPKQISRYLKLLQQQVEKWPADNATDEPRLWFAKMLQRQRKSIEAIEILLGVNSESIHYEPALRSARQIAIGKLLQIQNPSAEKAANAKAEREKFAAPFELIWKRSFESNKKVESDSMRFLWEMATAASVRSTAKLGIRPKSLQRIEDNFSTNREIAFDWQIAAISVLVYEYAMLDDSESSKKFVRYVRRLVEISPDQALIALERIFAGNKLSDNIVAEADDVVRLFDGKEELLSKASQSRLLTVRAKAFAAAGKTNESMQLFEDILEERPNDIQIRIEYATQLGLSSKKSQKLKSLSQWKVIAKRSPAKTENWYLSQLQIAKLLDAIGEREKAKNFLLYMQEVTGWKDSKLQPQFNDLLKSLR